MSVDTSVLARAAAVAVYAACLAGCASAPDSQTSRAPAPLKPIDVARFYTGRWHEIGRHPMAITDGCVAGTTDYSAGPDGTIIDRDACRVGTPDGKEKVFAGVGHLLDPGVNDKISVRYTVLGVFPVVRDYWMLDHADDYSWFISSDPSFKNLWIFTRDPQVSPSQRSELVARAKQFGYDVDQLEFPVQPAH